MKADRADRQSQPESQGSNLRPALIGAVLIAVAALFWFVMSSEPEPPPVAEPAAPIEEAPVVKAAPIPVTPDAPDIPEQVETVEPVEPAPEPERVVVETVLEPAPLTLETADPVVRESLQVPSPPSLYATALASENLVERAADLVAGAQRGYLASRALPLPPPPGKFQVQRREGGFYTDPASYSRYDNYVAVAEAVDPAALAGAFHTFRPLLEQAYSTLGFPAADFDNALIAALDTVLATPVVTEPQKLTLDVTTYHYADPELESLPSLQKQLLRMGPDNLQRLQAVAAQWRAALLAP